MRPFLSLVEVKLCPAENHLMTMLHEVFDKVLEIERTWTTVHKGYVVYREAGLERSVLEEHVQDNIGICVLLQFDDDADTLHGSLIIDIGNALYLLALHKFGNLLDHLTLVDHVRNLRNYDGLTS